ncbi:MAG: septum formation initiator family protein [Candidatus Fimenecus sp.]
MARRRSFILTLGLVLLMGYFVITFFSLRLSINERRSVLEQKNAAYQQQLAENERLKSVVESEDKSEYIEQVAREKLGYVMPGEKVFYDVTPGA